MTNLLNILNQIKTLFLDLFTGLLGTTITSKEINLLILSDTPIITLNIGELLTIIFSILIFFTVLKITIKFIKKIFSFVGGIFP